SRKSRSKPRPAISSAGMEPRGGVCRPFPGRFVRSLPECSEYAPSPIFGAYRWPRPDLFALRHASFSGIKLQDRPPFLSFVDIHMIADRECVRGSLTLMNP